MTTTTLIGYAEKRRIVKVEKELRNCGSSIYIVDYRRIAEGFPFQIFIHFEGGVNEMNEAKSFIVEKLKLFETARAKKRRKKEEFNKCSKCSKSICIKCGACGCENV